MMRVPQFCRAGIFRYFSNSEKVLDENMDERKNDPAVNDKEVIKAHFNAVYDETYDGIKRYAAAKCADPQYLADILQETYLEYYRLILRHGVDYADDPKALLYKIAKRRVYRYYSLRQRLAAVIPLFRENGDGEVFCTADEDLTAETDDEAIDKAEADRIWAIIRTYPLRTQKIMVLYFNCGLSHSEIAKETGMTLSGVKNVLYRTISEIRKKENGDE